MEAVPVRGPVNLVVLTRRGIKRFDARHARESAFLRWARLLHLRVRGPRRRATGSSAARARNCVAFDEPFASRVPECAHPGETPPSYGAASGLPIRAVAVHEERIDP